MIVILGSQSQFNDFVGITRYFVGITRYFVGITRYFFYVYLSLQPEDGSVYSSRDVLLCRNKVTVKKMAVFLCFLIAKYVTFVEELCT
jgi:hypothetical protein